MQTHNHQLGSAARELRLARNIQLTQTDLDEFDPFADDPAVPATFHSLKRVITREEAEERFELDMRMEAEYEAHCADVMGWRKA